MCGTVRGLKTTLLIPDPRVTALKRRAAERGTSLSALAVELLRRGLGEKAQALYEPNFPVFRNTGSALVDVADREQLHRVLDAERDARLCGMRSDDARSVLASGGEPSGR